MFRVIVWPRNDADGTSNQQWTVTHIVKEKLRIKKEELIDVEEKLVCCLHMQEELEKEKKTLEIEAESLTKRRQTANDDIKYLEDSLNKYNKVIRDLVTKLELGPAIANSNLIIFLTKSIEEKEAALACPVCLETAAAPIFMCQQQHLICSSCQPRVTSCPECREAYQVPPRRHIYAEKDAEELRNMQEELAKIIS